MSVPADAPRRGAARPRVVIQVFSDFECPYCARAVPTLERVAEDYGACVQIVWRQRPLPYHAHAQLAARAAAEVHRQAGDDAFWRFHDSLFEDQAHLARADLERRAVAIGGVDLEAFRAALDSDAHLDVLARDAATIDGLPGDLQLGTPTFFVNGYLVQGAQGYSHFAYRIEQALAAASESASESASASASASEWDVGGWQTILDAYVTSEGGFRYTALRQNAAHLAVLDQLVSTIASAEVGAWSRDAQLAFYINAYNILALRSVLDRWPLDSVMRSPGFFDGAAHSVAGVERTLNQLEGTVIRGDAFAEPRIHFAVNCASEGCPPLAQIAYTAANLEEQLVRQTDAFVRRTSRIERARRRVRVSQLFEWYADDFGGADGVRAFLVAHLEADAAAFVRDPSTRIAHFDYDWDLNAR